MPTTAAAIGQKTWGQTRQLHSAKMAQAITATISVARLHLARSSRVACPSPLLPSLPWCWQKQIAKAISMYLSSQGRPHMHTPLAATPRNYGSACEPHCGFATGKLSSIWPSVCECVCVVWPMAILSICIETHSSY